MNVTRRGCSLHQSEWAREVSTRQTLNYNVLKSERNPALQDRTKQQASIVSGNITFYNVDRKIPTSSEV